MYFGHREAECPKQVSLNEEKRVASNGFVAPVKTAKQPGRFSDGFSLPKQKSKLVYRPTNSNTAQSVQITKPTKPVVLGNSFGILAVDEGQCSHGDNTKNKEVPDNRDSDMLVDESDDEVENVYDETAGFIADTSKKDVHSEGASTPGINGNNV